MQTGVVYLEPQVVHYTRRYLNGQYGTLCEINCRGNVNGIVPNTRPADCPKCLRVYKKYWSEGVNK